MYPTKVKIGSEYTFTIQNLPKEFRLLKNTKGYNVYHAGNPNYYLTEEDYIKYKLLYEQDNSILNGTVIIHVSSDKKNECEINGIVFPYGLVNFTKIRDIDEWDFNTTQKYFSIGFQNRHDMVSLINIAIEKNYVILQSDIKNLLVEMIKDNKRQI